MIEKDVEINVELAEKLLNFSINKNTQYVGLSELNNKNMDRVLTYVSENMFDILNSSYSLGGTVGNCYSDRLFTISDDEETSFFYFDFLETFEDNLTVKQYKKLLSLAKDEIITSKDYYGGKTKSRVREVNLEDLNNLLEEFGFFESNEKITINNYLLLIKNEVQDGSFVYPRKKPLIKSSLRNVKNKL